MEAKREEARRTGEEARLRARRNEIKQSNTGMGTGVYCNLAVLPQTYASDFLQLCRQNPVALPLLEQLPAGEHKSAMAIGSNVSTDVPRYNIYRDGKLVKQGAESIELEWGPDHTGFLLGCSFTLETALAEAGLPARNMLEGKTPPVYVTSIKVSPSGVFGDSPVIVTLRWYRPEDLDRVRAATRPFPRQHGEPLAWGWKGAEYLGVSGKVRNKQVDLGEWSEPVGDEIPVFWGCGVTAEYAIKAANLPGVTLSHHPGFMFVTDLLGEDIENGQITLPA